MKRRHRRQMPKNQLVTKDGKGPDLVPGIIRGLKNIVVGQHEKQTFRISSRSSRKPSAMDAIQNFLNLSFINCSCAMASFSPLLVSGENVGIFVGGGEGEGETRRG
jgi:hypothetical protein